MVTPSLTPAEQTLTQDALIRLSAKRPARNPDIAAALTTYTGPVVLDALATARDDYVACGPVLTQEISDLNALLAKLTTAAGKT